MFEKTLYKLSEFERRFDESIQESTAEETRTEVGHCSDAETFTRLNWLDFDIWVSREIFNEK